MLTPVMLNRPPSMHRSSRHRPKPLSQRNLFSALFGLTSVVFLATAIVEPKWFSVKGGRCSGRYLGIYKMLTLKSKQLLRASCYSDDTTVKLKIVMAFLCCGALSSFVACLLDIWGPSRKFLRLFRANSIGNIITAVMSSLSCAFAYWVSLSIKSVSRRTASDDVHVTFSYSFYLVVAGGACALFACAFNMIKCHCRRNMDQLTSSEEELMAELMFAMDNAAPSTISGEPPPVYSV